MPNSSLLIEVEHLAELRAQIRAWRASGERIAFVPTMGNLHTGHLSLVREAQTRADRVVVSIFVNPLQFGPHEDLDAYPRTLDADRRQLAATGCALLFTPSVDEIYPRGQDAQTRVEVPGLSDILCGASRPGHFVGVATVVCKLLNMVQPDVALFGEKDFQQLLVIRRLVEDLAFPVEIVAVPTVREPDGLAMSSRNNYLTPEERALAPTLYQVLRATAEKIGAGEAIARAEQAGLEALAAAGLRPDYLSVRRAEDLAPAGPEDRALIILAAAYLGRARLIDNVRLNLDPR
ncbi:pantoate--beta-alanine ligase [Thermochromatium tepidum]|uniref:Pantothenate synthetase n=1 Tax=Thermochromatium tepidum ATCC 43061 TaxID=316276 RepID=A0A6I6DZ27_THETI|nr:pantoate--beta-alanine ligase [Thermochromatium tepidum]QGU31985.1 pantoate--beta-alanine ligase [Thermochromatium tepidum ATCC 43061]